MLFKGLTNVKPENPQSILVALAMPTAAERKVLSNRLNRSGSISTAATENLTDPCKPDLELWKTFVVGMTCLLLFLSVAVLAYTSIGLFSPN